MKTKKAIKAKTLRLADMIDAKKYGHEGLLNAYNDRIVLLEAEVSATDKANTKKKFTKQINELKAKQEKVQELVEGAGEPLTEEQAKTLLLRKHHNLIQAQLDRYLRAEQRQLVSLVEKLWDKYRVSRREIEQNREETLQKLDGFLAELGYIKS